MKIDPEKLSNVVSADALNVIEAAHPNFESSLNSLPTSQFISPRVISMLARVAEGCTILITGWAIAALHPGIGASTLPQIYIPLMIAVALAFPMLMQISGSYTMRSLLAPLARFSSLVTCWSLIFAVISVSIFFTKPAESYSRLWLGIWFFGGALGLLATRYGLSILVKRWNRNGQLNRHAVLVGGGEPAQRLFLALNDSDETDVTLVGIFDDRGDDRSPITHSGLPKLGNVTQLIDFVRRARVDLLLITLPVMAEERLLQVLKRLWILPVDIRLCAQNQQLRYRPRAYSYIGNVPFLDVFDKPLGEWGAILKLIEDKIIATLALVLLSPLMAIVAIAVKLESKGPVFFKQKRFGFNNELIEVYKFRSMFHEKTDFNAEKLTTKNDPRVTRVGKFIRRTSLDELPQLLNVLIGNLSLVGPRPHATQAKAADQLYNDVVDGYFARHRVKPGITGWAQVNGWRGETDTTEKLERRVEHDLYYIENWSLALDLYILFKTPLALLNSENAY